MGGNRYSVVLNSYGAIKEAYTRGTDFMDRDAEKLKQLLGVDDTIVSSRYNDLYKSSRKVGSQALRTLISSKLEELMDTELQDLNQVIDSSLGRGVDVSRGLQRVLTNTIGQLLFSMRYQHGDQDLDEFINNIHLWFQCVAEVDSVESAKVFMSKNIAACQKATKDLLDFLRIHVDEHLQRFDKGNVRDVIDAFIMDKDQCGYTVEQITSNMMMMLPDGSFTVYEIVLWMLLHLVNHPESQEEIHNEIQAVCDSGKVPIKDRARLPVTESFNMEVMRVVSPIQIGVDNKPLHSTTFRGYNIPEYVNITPYYGIVHRDPQLFPEPEEFQPHRFIKNGKIGNTEGFMPFGTGN